MVIGRVQKGNILKTAGYQPETFGETLVDSAHTGESFNHTSIRDIIEELSMPVIHSEFIFPDDLLSNGNSE